MDTFDNFQFDSVSSYGGIGVVDDTSSVYTTDADASSQSSRVPIESLENLSLDDNASDQVLYPGVIEEKVPLVGRGPIEHAFDEDLDNVLDELPDDSQVELPPHACRYARNSWST
jgi:regulator of nonsense transcripts 1